MSVYNVSEGILSTKMEQWAVQSPWYLKTFILAEKAGDKQNNPANYIGYQSEISKLKRTGAVRKEFAILFKVVRKGILDNWYFSKLVQCKHFRCLGKNLLDKGNSSSTWSSLVHTTSFKVEIKRRKTSKWDSLLTIPQVTTKFIFEQSVMEQRKMLSGYRKKNYENYFA